MSETDEPSVGQSARLDYARMIFADCGREISQQFSTMASNVTLATGTLAALLVLATRDSFGSGANNGSVEVTTSIGGVTVKSVRSLPEDSSPWWGLPTVSSVALIVLCLALFPLARWLMRSVISYQQLERFQIVQSYARGFANGDGSVRYSDLSQATSIYLDQWKSPSTFGKTVSNAAKYNGFYLIFSIAFVAIGWGFLTCGSWSARLVSALALLGFGLVEKYVADDLIRKYFEPYDPHNHRATEWDQTLLAPTPWLIGVWERNYRWVREP